MFLLQSAPTFATGLPDGYCFQTKNSNLCKFWKVLIWKILEYFMTLWFILGPLEIFHGHFGIFCGNWYIFSCFGILDQEKSGNHDLR
jgi:hypothetical protein